MSLTVPTRPRVSSMTRTLGHMPGVPLLISFEWAPRPPWDNTPAKHEKLEPVSYTHLRAHETGAYL
eukprot:7960881-Pyramimonas_sp.AAC.1